MTEQPHEEPNLLGSEQTYTAATEYAALANPTERPSDERMAIGVDVAARNQELEHILDPTQHLPQAETYPILGASYGPADLGTKYLPGGSLPVAEAAEQKRPLSFVLRADGRIAVSMMLDTQNGLSDNVLTVNDVRVSESGDGTGDEWKGKGYGKRIYLEVLKALPAGVELTSSSHLRPDGRRMWEWLVANGIANEREGYQPPPPGRIGPGEFITQINSLPR